MWIAYVLLLAPALTVRSAPGQIEYHDVDVQSTAERTTVAVVGVGPGDGGGDDRSSNLKFVAAIQKSSIWTDVRSRSMTIRTRPRLDGLEDKSPENLSDEDLAKLKRAYHDALKCVAVDQLLVLKSVTESTRTGSKVTVRMAIVKITKVLTEYTTEYHEDVYRYEEVTVSDNEKKVSSSVTAIVEDNRELCLPAGTSSRDVSGATGPDRNGATGPERNGTSGRDGNGATDPNENDAICRGTECSTSQNSTTTNVNLGRQNFGTINNYDWNFGTTNEATINAGGARQHGDQKDGQENNIANGGEEHNSTSNADQENSTAKGPEETRAQGTGNSAEQPHYGTPDDGGAPDLGFIFSGGGDEKTAAAKDDSATRTKEADDRLLLENGRGENRSRDESSQDVASVGSNNAAVVKKGNVHDGYLNNGTMKVYNINRGAINRGSLKEVNANGGIANVGTVNNYPINFGAKVSHVDDGTERPVDDENVQRYATSVDRAYSEILRRFAQ